MVDHDEVDMKDNYWIKYFRPDKEMKLPKKYTWRNSMIYHLTTVSLSNLSNIGGAVIDEFLNCKFLDF